MNRANELSVYLTNLREAKLNMNKSIDLSEELWNLWGYICSWLSSKGGIHGPVVHRTNLKRMIAIHDTPWTQAPVIEGLISLYKKSSDDYWLQNAVHLTNAQCSRQESEGNFKWAGHEDDRFSSLVCNALADCALLTTAEVLIDGGDNVNGNRYIDAVRNNIEKYLIAKLYSAEIGGFKMNPIDHYARRDRFILNMNSIAVEAMIRLDRLCKSSSYSTLSSEIGGKILVYQCQDGLERGAFAYSHLQPRTCITIYTALTLRSFRFLYELTGDTAYIASAKSALDHFNNVRDPATGLWFHMIENGTLRRFPIFISGAGIICNGICDAASLVSVNCEKWAMARVLTSFQLANGGISNFIKYNHPDNSRPFGNGKACWEDILPTPNWNAHAFLFLSRVIVPRMSTNDIKAMSVLKLSNRYLYFETRSILTVLSILPTIGNIFCLYIKKRKYGFAISFPFHKLTWMLLKVYRKLNSIGVN